MNLNILLTDGDSPAGAEERRMAPRFKVRLETRVLMIAAKERAGGGEELLPLAGHTADLSESGIGLVVSGEDAEALSSFGCGYELRLTVGLPAGTVDVTAEPVRRQPLAGDEWLIGARITDMTGRDRVLYMQFVRGLGA